jgi:type II secretory pathway component PulM
MMRFVQSLQARLSRLPLWQQRSVSERRTLLIAAAVLLAMALYQFLVLPARAAVAALEQRTNAQALQIAALQERLAQQQAPTLAAPSMTTTLSLPAQVETALIDAGFKGALKKIEALSEADVRVELSGVNFDRLISTIEVLASNQQISVSELSVDAIAPSTVNARMRLTR